MNSYRKSIQRLMFGNAEESASAAAEFESEESDSELRALLIRTRIAIKNRQFEFDLTSLDATRSRSPFLKGEISFVRGIYFMNKSVFETAEQEFHEAARFYREAGDPKRLLAIFNAWVAKMNADGSESFFERLQGLNTLLDDSQIDEIQNVKALILRQKGYFYFEEGLYLAAQSHGEEALKIFGKIGPESDYHLCLLHVADCMIELGDRERARVLLGSVPQTKDARVRYAFQYVESRISSSHMTSPPEDPYAPLHWRLRWEKAHGRSSAPPQPSWRIEKGWLVDDHGTKIVQMRPQSLEGRLLALLTQGASNKHVLIAALWPEIAAFSDLNLRFHQLIKRVNKKIGNRIAFDGERYVLRKH